MTRVGGVDLLAQDRKHQNPGKPELGRGMVVRAPSNIHDSMLVAYIGLGGRSHNYEIPGPNWMPRIEGPGGGGDPDYYALLPQEGAHCLIVIDHLGDAWVPVWNY